MKKQDTLKNFMKELPREEPSENFTSMVMNRVSLEPKKTPVVYQPLISRQGWRWIAFGVIFLGIGLAIFRNYFPGNEVPSVLQPLYSLDFSILLKPFNYIGQILNRLSPTVLAGMIAVSVLLFADQLVARLVRH
jgi:hypothetical protein